MKVDEQSDYKLDLQLYLTVGRQMIYSIRFDIMFVGEFIVHMKRVTGRISVTDDNFISANIAHLDVIHFL